MVPNQFPEGGYVPAMDRNHNPTAQGEMMRLLDECTRLGKENTRLRRGLMAARDTFLARGDLGYAKACDTFLMSNAELRGAKPVGEASRSNAVLGMEET